MLDILIQNKNLRLFFIFSGCIWPSEWYFKIWSVFLALACLLILCEGGYVFYLNFTLHFEIVMGFICTVGFRNPNVQISALLQVVRLQKCLKSEHLFFRSVH